MYVEGSRGTRDVKEGHNGIKNKTNKLFNFELIKLIGGAVLCFLRLYEEQSEPLAMRHVYIRN